MDELLSKAQTIIEQHGEQAQWLREEYNIKDEKQLAFVLEYIKTRKVAESYKSVYGQKMNTNVAAASASRVLRKVKFSIIDILNLTGHGQESITEALNKLKKESADKYLNHMEKLHKLDIQRVEHSGQLTIKYEKEFDED